MRNCFDWKSPLIALALGAALSACAAAVDGPKVSDGLVGRWRQVSITTGDRSTQCPGSISLSDSLTTSCGDNDVIEFHPDGTFTATFSGRPVKGAGTWRLSGNSLALSFTAPPGVAGTSHSATVTFDDGAKTLRIVSSLVGAATTETYTRL